MSAGWTLVLMAVGTVIAVVAASWRRRVDAARVGHDERPVDCRAPGHGIALRGTLIAGGRSLEVCKAILSLSLQYGRVTDDPKLTIAIEVRDAPIERGNEVSQPSAQTRPLLFG